MDHLDIITRPDRILGMQKLEELFNQKGYLICQSSGERVYDFNKITAIFVPLSKERDQVMAVHSDYALEFVQSCVLICLLYTSDAADE
ncbi:MAG TPA: hypothetical protein DD730_12400 [Desulfosporosinus sp.]|nr:hypothetical protein [Desulfosporosinus sp.]